MSDYQQLLAKKEELARQAAALEKQLAEARKAQRADVIAQVKALLAEHGLTVADLGIVSAKGLASKKAGSKVAPKYRHPETQATWSGRGLQPNWVKSELAKGRRLEEFAI